MRQLEVTFKLFKSFKTTRNTFGKKLKLQSNASIKIRTSFAEKLPNKDRDFHKNNSPKAFEKSFARTKVYEVISAIGILMVSWYTVKKTDLVYDSYATAYQSIYEPVNSTKNILINYFTLV